MAEAVFGSPIKKIYGEQASLTTTALHLGFRPGYHEVKLYCASAFRMGLAPRLASVQKWSSTALIADYTGAAGDRVLTTDVVLDAMAATDRLYLGVTDPTRGFYFTMDANVNSEAAGLDWEYCYDVSKPGYKKLTGTVSAALTVGETVTGQTSSATATHVYDDGSTYIIVKDMSGSFLIGEDVDGAAQTCDDLTAIVEDVGVGYFTDVAGDSDGTKNTQTLDQNGLYSFTLPAVAKGAVTVLSSQQLYWYRFSPSIALSAATQVNELWAVCDTVNYGFEQAGLALQFSLNTVQNGAFEFDHTGTGTLDIDWIMH